MNINIDKNLSPRVCTTALTRGRHSHAAMYRYTPAAIDKITPMDKSDTGVASTIMPPRRIDRPAAKFNNKAIDGLSPACLVNRK
mmetsp:Transcript_10041/g.15057  ORF Transcript_10041/g.15057 Transcript_10041/m.15057 type:complete len:84 (-) Transcript_10041:916-1167(-)